MHARFAGTHSHRHQGNTNTCRRHPQRDYWFPSRLKMWKPRLVHYKGGLNNLWAVCKKLSNVTVLSNSSYKSPFQRPFQTREPEANILASRLYWGS